MITKHSNGDSLIYISWYLISLLWSFHDCNSLIVSFPYFRFIHCIRFRIVLHVYFRKTINVNCYIMWIQRIVKWLVKIGHQVQKACNSLKKILSVEISLHFTLMNSYLSGLGESRNLFQLFYIKGIAVG